MAPRPWALAVVLLPVCGACTEIKKALPGVAYHTSFEGRFIDQIEPPEPAGETLASAHASDTKDGAKALSGQSERLSLLDSEGLVKAPAFQAYLEQVLARALEGYLYHLAPMTVGIDASSNVAAWATPDNQIFVTLGLLENLESESELATALAHEAGHVQLGHFSRTAYLDDQRAAVTAGAGMAMMAVAVSNMRMNRSGGGVTLINSDPRETEEKSAQAATLAWLINGVSDQVLNGQWSRKQEQEADLFATDLIIAAGHNPRAPADLFQLLGQLWGKEVTYEAFLEAEEDRIGQDLKATGTPLAMLQALPSKAIEFGASATNEAWRRFGRSHIDIDERRTAVLEYTRREYQGQRVKAAAREADTERYRSALRAKLPEAVRERHRAANEAQRLLAEGKVAEAEEKAQFAVTGPTSGSAHTRAVLYMVRKAQGLHDKALANLERIDRAEFRPRRVFEFQAAEYITRQRYDDALAVLDAGAAQFGTAEPFLPSRIEVQVAMDRIEDARETYAACESTTGAIRSWCDTAIERAPEVAGNQTTFGPQERIEDIKGFAGGFLPTNLPGFGGTE